jgi:proteasome lid subunit RPN8/RPN11
MELTLTLPVYAQLQWLLRHTPNEVAGFGVTTNPDRPLYVDQFVMPRQEISPAYVEMDGESVGELLEKAFDEGLEPWQVNRIWVHTHPSGINEPSNKDEQTFGTEFGKCDYAIMLIFPKPTSANKFSPKPYCRIRYTSDSRPFGKEVIEDYLDVVVDWGSGGDIDAARWKEIFEEVCAERKITYTPHNNPYIPRKSHYHQELLMSWDEDEWAGLGGVRAAEPTVTWQPDKSGVYKPYPLSKVEPSKQPSEQQQAEQQPSRSDELMDLLDGLKIDDPDYRAVLQRIYDEAVAADNQEAIEEIEQLVFDYVERESDYAAMQVLTSENNDE